MTGRCRVQRDIDGIQIVVVETPMTVEPGPVVRACRIDANDVQPRIARALHTRPGHDGPRHVVAQAIVVAGDRDQAFWLLQNNLVAAVRSPGKKLPEHSLV